ncbi:hypothetical protein SGFS_064960 [Streptomyces graminofaciens]|uniref:Lipoprotein n=2 Tax=Streptomyces graminofaciens TaxID=68212 RepID=A0ABN5VP05_9ACTN|nr:hypothetical protein SGFS_064960 [Streptomyces graminofaciens]
MALSLALLTGCSGGGSEKAGEGSAGKAEETSGGGATAAAGPAYEGPELPGFAREAAWSLASDGDQGPGALDLDGTLLFAKDARGAYLPDLHDDDAFLDPDAWDSGYAKRTPQGPNRVLYLSETPQRLTLEFRDAKTGKVRGTLKATTDSVTLTTWRDGTPALAVGRSETAGSDGLTAERTTSKVTLYDAEGHELGRTVVPRAETDTGTDTDTGLYYAAALTGGHRVEAAGDTLRLVPVGDGTARTVPCTEEGATCEFSPETGLLTGARATAAPVLDGRYYAGFENANVSGSDMVRVTLNDLTTGKKIWSSADAEIPPGVELYDDGEPGTEPTPASETLSLLDVSDGEVLLAWMSSRSTSDIWIHARYDLESGELTDSFEATEAVLYAPSGDLAAEDRPRDGAFTGTTVWQLPGGKELWAQKQGSGENPLDPVRFTADGKVLYGLTITPGSSEKGLAVDPRTREVLAKDLPTDHVPVVDDSSGYGFLTTGAGFFAFAPAS